MISEVSDIWSYMADILHKYPSRTHILQCPTGCGLGHYIAGHHICLGAKRVDFFLAI